MACRKTCELYNGCADLEDEDTANGIEERLAGVDVGDEVLDLEIDNNDTDSSSSSCQDSPGKFLNHNSHLKDCVWLHNNKDGISDRKDMNCGGRSVEDASTGGVIIYVTTELGLACRQTCALYNGCADAEDMNTAENGIEERLGDVDNENEEDNDEVEEEELDEDEVDENAEDDDDDDDDEEEELHSIAKSIAKDNVIMRSYSSPLISYSLTTTCVDGTGEYMDHKLSPKPCKWLEEASEHQQSINCGSEKYGITELGMECPWSCREYNDCE